MAFLRTIAGPDGESNRPVDLRFHALLWERGTRRKRARECAWAAERARALLAAAAPLAAESPDPARPLGLSIGVAIYMPGDGEKLDALIARPVFYELVEMAAESRDGGELVLGIWSRGEFFRLGAPE